MSRATRRLVRLRQYWRAELGDGPCAHTGMALSVMVLALLYLLCLPWMIPSSIVRSIWSTS